MKKNKLQSTYIETTDKEIQQMNNLTEFFQVNNMLPTEAVSLMMNLSVQMMLSTNSVEDVKESLFQIVDTLRGSQ